MNSVNILMTRWLRSIVVLCLALLTRELIHAQGDAYTLVTNAPNSEELRNYALGPIGGQYRVTDHATYARIVSINSGGPGAAAGLLAGDVILGVFGKELPPTGQAPSGDNWGGHHGVTEELGFAIDRAEGVDGQLPLTILRPGVGLTNVVVRLSALGAYGATYPIASPKYDVTYELAVRYLHDNTVSNNGSMGYFSGWAGLCLLGHPDWDKSTGARPYRNSINLIRDSVIAWLNSENMAGTEDRFYNGTPNPKAKGGASNWYLGARVMFLAEYYQKTRDTDDAARVAQVRAALQRGAEMLANSIQWWKQPNLLASPGYYSPSGKTIAGMVSHGGVTGDYIHLGWGGGINICGVHNFMGFSFARRVGVDMTTRPQDGHYFGYTKSEFGTLLNTPGSPFYGIEVVEAGKELYDHTVQEKFLMQWNLLAYRNAAYSTPGDLHDGHVCYQFEGWNPEEAVGKTAATIVGMMMYQADGGQLTTDDIDRLNRMKLFVARNYMRQQDSHAFCVGAQAMTTLSIPFLNDRQQRFLLDNWRFFYALGRDQDLRFSYFRSRYVNDNYLGEDMPMAINVALPGAVLNGRLSLLPGLNRDRLIARFDNPDMRWPKYEARLLRSESRVVSMPVTILDGNGLVVDPAQCTIQWTKVSGLGDVTFGANSITFSSDGIYRVNLRVSHGNHTLDEPIDIIVRSLPVPSGYVAGSADYRVYKDITGATVASLTNHWKFPDFPDEQLRVSSTAGTHSGDNYGSSLGGVILIPVTGTYRFYVASDDASELRINTAGLDGFAGPVVASVAGAVSANSFKVLPSQASAVFQLNAGDVVGFLTLQKEGTGGDHLSVGWSINGADPTVIPGHFLAHPVGQIPLMSIVAQPVSVRTTLGSPVSLSISTMGPTPAMFQWRKNGVQIEGATDPTLTFADVSAGTEGEYDCTYTTTYGTLVSAKARIAVVDVGQIIAGALWQEVYVGIGGVAVSDLTSNAKFPYLADQSGPITSAATSALGDNYGQRWSGWITPPSSGNYRFYVASDDEVQVLLSTDDTVAKAVSILAKGGYTEEKQWSARTPSAYVSLVAGQRYYIEVRHKEGGGGDHCSLAWQLQGQPAPVNGTGEIPGSVLSYRSGGLYADTLLTNAAPEFSPVTFDAPIGFVGKAYPATSLSTFALDRNSIDLPSLVFTKVSGPSWLTVAANGNLSGTPAPGDLGTNQFTVRLTDPGGLTGQGTLRVVVRPSNVPPAFVSSPVTVGNGVSYVRYTGQNLAGKVTDSDVDEVLSFAKLSGPEWLGVAADGALSGVPTFADAGTNTFSVRVGDIAGNLVTNVLKVIVDPVRARLSINGVPVSGSVLTGYNKDANLTLSADILRGSSVVSSVEFSIDGVLLSTDSTAPYTAAWGAIPAGTHVMTAKVRNTTSYAAFNLPPITIQVEDPPVVLPRSFVATSTMKFGQTLGRAGATLGTGRTLAGWTLLSDTNTFDLTTDGLLSLLKPEWLPTGIVKSLRVRAADTTGAAGEGLIHILCNPPVAGMKVTEQRWSGSSAYANQVWTDTPSYTGSLDGFTSASNVGEDFSRRMTGLIRVPSTGDYTFWVASDDGSRLLLSSDDNPANSVQIAYLNNAVSAGNWTGNASQQSAAIRLVAGRAYWLEVHHREIGGGDFVSVAWQGPGFSRRLITSSDLYPPTTVSNPAWIGLDQPTTTDEFIRGQTLTLTTKVVAGTSPITRVDFRSGDTLIGSDATAPYTLEWQGIPDGTLTLTATAVTDAGSVTSDPVSIQVEFVPQVKATTIVATRTMPTGTVVGTATATVAAGRTISPNGWSITSGNISNAFKMGLNGQIILSNPAQLTAMNTALLGIRATDNAGKSGDGVITVINNPPLSRSVTEEQWIDSSTYPNVNWAGAPSYSGTLETFTVHNTASSRTRRISGYIQPPVSGEYRFHVASDDQSELYLSTDHTPANVVKLAYEPSWSGYQSFTGTGTMKSEAIPLVAGKVYYMEARHWVQTGEEHVSVGWTVPGAASAVQVPSSALFPSYTVSAPAWVGLVTANNSANQLAGVPFTLNSAVVNGTEAVATVEFYQGVNRIGTVTNAPFRFTVSSPIAGTYTYVAKALKADGAVIAESLPYAVTVKQNDDLSIDADGDGFSSAIEILLGTDPQNATSFPSSLYTGLVGWWRMDEGTGSALTNGIPLGAAGTVQGTAAWTGGTSGMGLTLDGTSNYVTFGDSATLLGAVDFTASLWVRIQPGTTGGRLVQQRGPNINGQYAADVNSQGKVSFYVYNNGYQFNITTTQSVNDGKWHMLTFTREGVNGRIHIDDVLAVSGSGSSAVALASNPFVVGRDQRGQNSYCPGTVDELRLYSRALSADEIAALYAEPANLPMAPVFASNPISASDASVGVAYKADLSAWTVDPNVRKTDLLTFTRLSGPSWLTINAAGLATGTPAVDDIGSNQWGVRVTDASGNSAEAMLSIQVVAENFWNNASGGSWATTSNWKTGVCQMAWVRSPSSTASTSPQIGLSPSTGRERSETWCSAIPRPPMTGSWRRAHPDR